MLRLQKLSIKNYRQFTTKELQFSDGINIIYGENEKGKSTTISSIVSLFYADSSTNSKTILDYIQSWGSGIKPILKAEMTYEGKKITILKDFEKKKTHVDIDGRVLEDSRKSNLEISKIIGIGSPDIYKAVGIFKGGELSEVSQNGKLKESLTGISTGEDVNALKALKNIEKAIEDLSKGLERIVKVPGKIKILRDDLTQKKKSLNELKEREKLYIQSQRQYQVAKESLGKIDQDLSGLETMLEKNKRLTKAKMEIEKYDKEINAIHIQLEEIAELTNKLEDIKKLRGEILPKGIDFKEFLLKYEGIEGKKKELEEKKNNLSTGISNLTKELLRFRENANSQSKFVLKPFDLLLACITTLLFISTQYFNAFALYLTIAAISAMIYLFYNLFKVKKTLVKPDSEEEIIVKQQIEKSDDDLKLTSEQLLELDAEHSLLLEKFKIKSIEEFRKLQKKAEDLDIEIDSFQEIVFSKAEKNKFDNIENFISNLKEQERRLIISKKEISITELEELQKYEISGESFVAYEQKYKKLSTEKKAIEEEYITSKERAKNLSADLSQVAQLEEGIYELENEEIFWSKKLNSLELASIFMDRAIKATTKGASSKIESELKKYLPKITNDRYSEVKVFDDFAIEVFSREKDAYVNPEMNLSSGTVEQIYFLAKIAYLNLISNEQYPPILLDDPFLTFDKDRTIQCFEILREIGKRNQIIFFTCHEQYLPFADNVITL